MGNYAVITSDLVKFTEQNINLRKQFPTQLENLFSQVKSKVKGCEAIEVLRGDTFQCLLSSPENALRVILLFRTALLGKMVMSESIDMRTSLAIGQLDYLGDRLSKSDGEVFHVSGRKLEAMSDKSIRLVINTNWVDLNLEMEVATALLEALVMNWTSKQCEILYYKLLGFSELDISTHLNIAQPTVNRHIARVSWKAIDKLLERFENIVKTKIFIK